MPAYPAAAGLSSADGESAGEADIAALMIVSVAGMRLALRLETIGEILPIPLLMRLPEAPPAVLGAFRLGATIRLVLDLRCLVGLAPPLAEIPGDHHLLLPQRQNDDTAVFLVDRAEDIVSAPVGPCPEPGLNGCVAGQATVGEEVIPLLAMDRLLDAAARERLAAFARRSIERAELLGIAVPT